MRSKESGGHHTHDGEWHIVEVDRPPQHVRRAVVAAGPKAVAGHRDTPSPRAHVVGRSERAAEQRKSTEDVEVVAGDRGRLGRSLDLLAQAALARTQVALGGQAGEY